MATKKRRLPPEPDMGGVSADWDRMAQLRAGSAPSPPTPAPAPASPAPAAQEPAPTKTRRSWYTDQASAEAFQAAVDDIHHSTRAPKHVVVGALLRRAAAEADDVAAELASHPSHA